MRKQLILIALFVALVAGVALYLQGVPAALAAVFGGGITVINLLLTNWHLRRAERLARADAAQNLRILFRCALERIVASVVLLSIGLIVLQLPPLAMIGGFGVALAAQYLAG
jgi:F0F1-type ATP synthase assembly protein I